MLKEVCDLIAQIVIGALMIAFVLFSIIKGAVKKLAPFSSENG